MAKWHVTINETNVYEIEVEADTEDEAQLLADELWSDNPDKYYWDSTSDIVESYQLDEDEDDDE